MAVILFFNFLNDHGIAVGGDADNIRLVCGAAGDIGGFRLQCDVVKIHTYHCVAAQVIGGFFQL